MAKRISKTKAYVFEVNPAYTSNISMDVPRASVRQVSQQYMALPTCYNIPMESPEAVAAYYTKSMVSTIEHAIASHKRKFKAESVSLVLTNSQLAIVSEVPETDREYEIRRKNVIRGRLTAEKAKQTSGVRQTLKDMKLLEELSTKYKLEGVTEQLKKITVNESTG